MKKSRIVFFLATGMLLFFLTGGSWAYDFNDVTRVEKWKNGAVVSTSIDLTPWTGVVGDANVFNTFGAYLSGSILTITTNWNPRKDRKENDVTDPLVSRDLYTADLFIEKDFNGTFDGTFDYAIGLDYNTNYINNMGNVYVNPGYQTSNAFWLDSGHIYGGQYDDNYVSPSYVPVHATTEARADRIPVAWTLGTGGLNNQVSINLTGLVGPSDNWYFVWGTANCGNDTITGKVPEPTSMLLLGLGLIGVAGVRRKFRQ